MRITEIEKRPLYTIISVSSNWDEIKEIGNWCLQHQCGKNVGLRRFSFKTDEELTMFRLKWENNNE